MTRPPKTTLRLIAVAWPFVLIVILQTALATFSLQVTSSLRAFVTGESLWSKGQHDALYYLNRYAESGNRSFVDRYHQAMAIPMGDRAARLALEASPADNAAAFEGFLKGGNHPDDIPNVIWLFRYFRWLPIMDASIRDWRTAEGVLMQLLPIGEGIDASRHISDVDRRDITRQLDEINALVTPLTRRFSDRLGEGTRDRVQVPRPVVEDGDQRHRAPFVEGTTPSMRVSGSTAARRARASALNWASTMWCGSRPRTRSRCTHRPAFRASDSTTW